MISSKAEVYVYIWGEPLSCVKLVGKYQGALLYLEEPSFRFSFLSHSFTVCMYTRSLSLAGPLPPHAVPYSWKGLRHSYNNGNCRCRRQIDRTWTPSSFTEVADVEVFWISSELCWQRSHCRQKRHILQALLLDGRLFGFSFQSTEDICYCYFMLLINVLNLTM